MNGAYSARHVCFGLSRRQRTACTAWTERCGHAGRKIQVMRAGVRVLGGWSWEAWVRGCLSSHMSRNQWREAGSTQAARHCLPRLRHEYALSVLHDARLLGCSWVQLAVAMPQRSPPRQSRRAEQHPHRDASTNGSFQSSLLAKTAKELPVPVGAAKNGWIPGHVAPCSSEHGACAVEISREDDAYCCRRASEAQARFQRNWLLRAKLQASLASDTA